MRPGLCVGGEVQGALGASDTLTDMVRQIREDEPVWWHASCSDDITSVLDAIPGAWERMQLGREQAARGDAGELGAMLSVLPVSR